MTYLLDSSVLIARCFAEHVHHSAAVNWLDAKPSFAVCPITEGALVRFAARTHPRGPLAAQDLLEMLSVFSGFHFWPDDISYKSADLQHVQGHNQVTDAYLAALAKEHRGKLATFDQALPLIHPSVELVPLVD